MTELIKTSISLDQFNYEQGTNQELAFAKKGISLLIEIINNPDFESSILNAKFSYCIMLDGYGGEINVNNQKVFDVIKTGQELKTESDYVLNLQIKIKKLQRKVVGFVNPSSPIITTNKRFFRMWMAENEHLSLAAHWLHEWLHVAGFHHNYGSVDRSDVNYTVGQIVVKVGRLLLAKKEDENTLSNGQGYLDAMEDYYETINSPSFEQADLEKSAQNSLQLGYLDIGSDEWQEQGKAYPIILASSGKLKNLPVPASNLKTLKVDVIAFFNDHLPDFFGGVKEGIFKVSINTRNPQSPTTGENEVIVAIDFKVKDNNYAAGFLHKGLFKNVLFTDFINLKFDLFEVDSDAKVYYEKVRNVVDSVPEMRTLDILNGIPYLNLATKLFEGIIKTFGKNADDHIWNEMPTLEITPLLGGAFLRNGIYIIFEERNSKKEKVGIEDFVLKDKSLIINSNKITRLPNHMIFSIGISSTVQPAI